MRRTRPAEPEPIWRAISKRSVIWPGPSHAAEKPAFPLIQNALYFNGLRQTLGPATLAALDQAVSPQDWKHAVPVVARIHALIQSMIRKSGYRCCCSRQKVSSRPTFSASLPASIRPSSDWSRSRIFYGGRIAYLLVM
jgi:hypothetical protein